MKTVKLFACCMALFMGVLVNTWSQEYNILDYGAVSDCTTVNTASIQSAIDECSRAGGGKVIIPTGIYLSGTIKLKSNVNLHFEHNSTLLGSPDMKDYPYQPTPEYRSLRDEKGHLALIYARKANNIALTGYGTIDGQGQYKKIASSNYQRTKNLLFISCKKIRVEGLHFKNSGFWNQHYMNCEDGIVRNISVFNHCNYNNDAIDLDGCRRFIVSDCIFDTDDDGITLKSTGPAPTEDIVITNCIVSTHCNAIKAGTESSGGFRNVTISNCVVKPSVSKTNPFFHPTKTGITGLSLIIVDGGTMEGINVNNITIYGTEAPIYIRLGNRARKYAEGIPKPDVGKIRNISLNNITVYGAGSWGSSITGIPDHPVENITLSNIQIFTCGGVEEEQYNKEVEEAITKYPQPTVWKELPAYGLYIRHAQGFSIDNAVFGVKEKDARVPLVAEDVKELRVTRTRLSGRYTPESFLKGKSLKNYQIAKPLGWEGEAYQIMK